MLESVAIPSGIHNPVAFGRPVRRDVVGTIGRETLHIRTVGIHDKELGLSSAVIALDIYVNVIKDGHSDPHEQVMAARASPPSWSGPAAS